MNNFLPLIFDRKLLRQRRSALKQDDVCASRLYRYLNEELTERLSLVKRSFKNVLVLGDYLPVIKGVETLWHFSLTGKGKAAVFDDEFLPFGQAKFDLIISFMEMHYFNDIPGFLQQVNHCLKPDGLFTGVMLGQDTLWELRHAMHEAEEEVLGGVSPRVAPMLKMSDAAALMQRAGFALPVVDLDQLKITYDTTEALLLDLKQMGLTNIHCERSKASTKQLLKRLEQIYQERSINIQQRPTATFSIIYLNGWSPAASQQKALKPGSATAKLVDFLNKG